MTGFNHAATGALVVAVVGSPLIAIPIAFVLHFVLDAIPHFGWDMGDDVFKRNRSKSFKVTAILETPLSIAALIALPIVMMPIVNWWITLLVMLSAMSPDLIWLYRGVREELTKKVKPRNGFMNFHLKVSHHHSRLVLGMLFEMTWFAGALGLILWQVYK